MILLLGSASYIGQAFGRALRHRAEPFIPLTLNALDYSRFDLLLDYIRKAKPELVINAEEYANPTSNGSSEDRDHRLSGVPALDTRKALAPSTSAGKGRPGNGPDVGDASPFEAEPVCADAESDRLRMLQTNTVLPQTIAKVCALTKTPWGHVSSGSIFTGARIAENGEPQFEGDLTSPAVRRLFAAHPDWFLGFTEMDEPNFCFRQPPCTFYSGTKALAEEAIREEARAYIWRFHMPFNDQALPNNLLFQLQQAVSLSDAVNSLSHLDECVDACIELWDRDAPFGIYNVVNPGAVATHDLVRMVQSRLRPQRFQLLPYERDPAAAEEENPRSNCILDSTKLALAGISLRPIHEAVQKALEGWARSQRTARRSLA